MGDTGIRAEARKDLRDYDNPKGGRNLNYHNQVYLEQILLKWGKDLAELRMWANEIKHRRQHK